MIGLPSINIGLRFLILATALVLSTAGAVLARERDGERETAVAQLMSLLRFDAVVEILAEEGHGFAADLAQQHFPHASESAAWQGDVARIFSKETMLRDLADGLYEDLEPERDWTTLRLFERPGIQEIIAIEIAARRYLLSPQNEAEAAERAAELSQSDPVLFSQIAQFFEATDAVDRNVAASMNAELAFYRGLAQAGVFGEGWTEAQLLADVNGAESTIRAFVSDWLWSFATTAYAPVDPEMRLAFFKYWATPEGLRLYAAQLAVFQRLAESQNHALGVAAARFITNAEL